MNRLLELPLSEIRHELDRNTSNAGMLQSGMLHLTVGESRIAGSNASGGVAVRSTSMLP
jgi:hypothetical protein